MEAIINFCLEHPIITIIVLSLGGVAKEWEKKEQIKKAVVAAGGNPAAIVVINRQSSSFGSGMVKFAAFIFLLIVFAPFILPLIFVGGLVAAFH